jgi:hypothetical protein
MEYCMGALRVKRSEGCADNDSVKTPAWSLSALLALIPTSYETITGHTANNHVGIVKDNTSTYSCVYGTDFRVLAKWESTDPISCVTYIVEWLVTNGIILNNDSNEND